MTAFACIANRSVVQLAVHDVPTTAYTVIAYIVFTIYKCLYHSLCSTVLCGSAAYALYEL
jgi:hypothetical protein